MKSDTLLFLSTITIVSVACSGKSDIDSSSAGSSGGRSAATTAGSPNDTHTTSTSGSEVSVGGTWGGRNNTTADALLGGTTNGVAGAIGGIPGSGGAQASTTRATGGESRYLGGSGAGASQGGSAASAISTMRAGSGIGGESLLRGGSSNAPSQGGVPGATSMSGVITATGGEWAYYRGGSDGGPPQGGSSTSITTRGGDSSTAGAGSNPDGGSAGSRTTTNNYCSTPECCVPLTINSGRISLYKLGNDIYVNAVVEHEAYAATIADWNTLLSITTPWGQTLNCTAKVPMDTHPRFIQLSCPKLTLTSEVACDTEGVFRFYIGNSAGAPPGGSACSSAASAAAFDLTLAIGCPGCPSGSASFDRTSCDYPLGGPSCSYTAKSPGTGAMQLPCLCRLDSATGALSWSCAVA